MLNIAITTFCFLVVILVLIFVFYLIYINLLPGAFYYPSTNKAIEDMLNLAKITPSDTLIDLGSGDGKIIIAAATRGAKAIGYELNPLLVIQSRRQIKSLKLDHLASIHLKNFWKADFNEASVIIIYQFPRYLKKLETILSQKIKKPTIVISNTYPFPHKKHYLSKISSTNKLYLYRFGDKI